MLELGNIATIIGVERDKLYIPVQIFHTVIWIVIPHYKLIKDLNILGFSIQDPSLILGS